MVPLSNQYVHFDIIVEVNAICKAFVTIEKNAKIRKIFSQIPMLVVFFGLGRFEYFVNWDAFVRIFIKLFNSANNGASGNAEENRMTKPNWIDKSRYSRTLKLDDIGEATRYRLSNSQQEEV